MADMQTNIRINRPDIPDIEKLKIFSLSVNLYAIHEQNHCYCSYLIYIFDKRFEKYWGGDDDAGNLAYDTTFWLLENITS